MNPGRYEGYQAYQQEQNNAVSIARIEAQLVNMDRDLKEISKQVKELNTASARVKGGIFVVLLIGGIIGWLTTLGSTIVKVWPFH